MAEGFRGLYYRAVDKMDKMRERVKERRSESKLKKLNRQIDKKKEIKHRKDKIAKMAKKSQSMSALKTSSGQDAEEQSLAMNLEKWGKNSNLPEWAIKQLQDQVLGERRQRKHQSDLDKMKDDMLNKYSSKHWIVTGKAMKEDDLAVTPYPYQKGEIKPGAGIGTEKPLLALTKLKETHGEEGQDQGTDTTKDLKSSEPKKKKAKKDDESKDSSAGDTVLDVKEDLDNKGSMERLIQDMFANKLQTGDGTEANHEYIFTPDKPAAAAGGGGEPDYDAETQTNAMMNLALCMPSPEDKMSLRGKRGADVKFHKVVRLKDFSYHNDKLEQAKELELKEST